MSEPHSTIEESESELHLRFEEIRASAIRLINQNLDFDSLTAELSNNVADFHHPLLSRKVEGLGSVNELTILESLKLQAEMSEMEINVVASQMILKKLNEIAMKHSIMSSDPNQMSAVFSVFKKVGKKLKLEDITQYQGKFQHCLPLDVLLALHERGIIVLKDYLIINVSNRTVLREFVWALQHVTSQRGEKIDNKCSDYVQTGSGILTQLIHYGYSDDKSYSRALKKMCGYILFNIVKNHLYHLISLPACKTVTGCSSGIIREIRERLKENQDTLRKCFLQMVTLWVTDSPNLKVSDAISTQHMWTASKQAEALISFYKEMTMCIGVDKMVSTLGNVLERREVNWKHLLTFISALLIGFIEARKALGDFITEKLKKGYEVFSAESLTVSFLFVRQLSLEGSHAFSSYATWFHDNFGAQSTLISSNRAARFLIRFLSDIAPYEPVKYLKAHIVKPPVVPPSCAEDLNEYMVLARIRIVEQGYSLAEVTEDSSHSDGIKMDVQKFVEEYEKNSRIPKSLMEASIFQKTYFCKKFLPVLLKPRPLPSIPDASMKLIEDLYKAQKIPKSMYAAYVDGCKQENKKLLEEVMILDEDSAFDDENPHEQLTLLLGSISKEILQQLNFNEDVKISPEVIANMNRILDAAFPGSDTDEMVESVINLNDASQGNDFASKIVHDLFDWLGELQECYFEPIKGAEKVGEALAVILLAFQQHRVLHTEISCQIWKTCTSQLLSTSEKTLRGISLYLVLAGADTKVKFALPRFCRTRILKSESFTKTIENWKMVAVTNLFSVIVHNLPFHKGKEFLLSSFKVVCYVVHNMISLQKDHDSWFIVLFKQLGRRISMSGPGEEVSVGPPPKCAKLDGFVAEIEKCRALKENLLPLVTNSEQINTAAFLETEIVMCTDNDILNSELRHHLYSKIFFASEVTESELKYLVHFFLDELNIQEDLKEFPNQEIVSFILKNLSLLFESCNEVKSSAKFMYELLVSRLQFNDQNNVSGLSADVTWRNEVNAAAVFLQALPPLFLFCRQTQENNEQEDIFGCKRESHGYSKTENLQFAGKLVNESLFEIERRPSFAFSLSQNLTIHLVKGILENCTSVDEFFKFSILFCPFLFISLLVHWNRCHELPFLLKLRNHRLHSLVNTVHSLLSDKSAITQARKTLQSGFSHYQCNEKNQCNISFCLAGALCDMPTVEMEGERLVGLSQEELGCMACCVAWKIDLGYQHFSSISHQRSILMLQFCLDSLDPEYFCNDVLSEGVPGLENFSGLSGNQASKFGVAWMRALSLIDVSLKFLESKFFLSALSALKKSVSSSLSDVLLMEVAPNLQNLEKNALRRAPDAAVTLAAQKFPDEFDLRFEAERRNSKSF